MLQRTAVINVVGLNRSLLVHAPNINALVSGQDASHEVRTLVPCLPAVTTSVQSSMLTGTPPLEHGIVGNGWYNREYNEIHFWKQSNNLVRGRKVWQTARDRDPTVTCANMFWWYNMYSSVDYSVTPRPIYKADGLKIPDCYSHPADLRDILQSELGRFPLFHFWGPLSSIRSSEWIAAASKLVVERTSPTLTLVYLPHLDYSLQKLGPDHRDIPNEVKRIDAIVGNLIAFFQNHETEVLIVSEYGVEPVDNAVYINRVLREAGELHVREEDGCELLDAGASGAFAVADHQIAHVYINDPAAVSRIAALCSNIHGVDHVIKGEEKREWGIAHSRAGDLVLVAAARNWFTYDYWMDNSSAPDFARTVDIHRKPGYDPRELFIDPQLRVANLQIAWKLLKKRLGFRTVFDVIPLDASLVRGSHGRPDLPFERAPILITPGRDRRSATLPCTKVHDVILEHLFNER